MSDCTHSVLTNLQHLPPFQRKLHTHPKGEKRGTMTPLCWVLNTQIIPSLKFLHGWLLIITRMDWEDPWEITTGTCLRSPHFFFSLDPQVQWESRRSGDHSACPVAGTVSHQRSSLPLTLFSYSQFPHLPRHFEKQKLLSIFLFLFHFLFMQWHSPSTWPGISNNKNCTSVRVDQ